MRDIHVGYSYYRDSDYTDSDSYYSDSDYSESDYSESDGTDSDSDYSEGDGDLGRSGQSMEGAPPRKKQKRVNKVGAGG